MLGKIEEIEERQVQPDWNQNDENAPEYIKNRPFYEEVTPLFPDTTFKFNEQGSLPGITLESDEPLLVDGDILYFESLNPELEVRYGGGSFSPDGKTGSIGFGVYDLNGQSRGGGAGALSYDGDANKYIFAISGSGNPSVVADLQFTITRQYYKKIDSNFIDIEEPLQLQLHTDKLTINPQFGNLCWQYTSPDFTITPNEKITFNDQDYYGLTQMMVEQEPCFFHIHWNFYPTEDISLDAKQSIDLFQLRRDITKTRTGLFDKFNEHSFTMPFRLGYLSIKPSTGSSDYYLQVSYYPLVADTLGSSLKDRKNQGFLDFYM